MSDKEKLTSIGEFETFLGRFTPTPTNIRDFWVLYKKLDDVAVFEQKIAELVRGTLINPNTEVVKFALDLFANYLSKGLFTNEQYLTIAYLIIDVMFRFNTETIEAQELWVNLIRVLQLLDAQFDKLCEAKSAQMLSILGNILKSDIVTGPEKSKAFIMLQKYVKVVNVHDINNDIFPIWRSQILPQTFALQSDAYDLANHLLPWAQQIVLQQDQNWDLICSDIQSKYIPILLNYIYNNNQIYSKLWIFLIKLFTCKLHKGLPVINSLLSVVETAFKAQDTNIRKEAFHCWQGLIDCINFATQEVYTEKRIKLLLIPLKTNNCKTEELIIAKFDTWCRLLRVLHHKHIIEPYVVETFLNFCFGPLWDAPLKSYATPGIASPGKKYASLHFNSCVCLLQLISNEQYHTELVQQLLSTFNFVSAKISLGNFAKISKTVIYAVGEACVLLSQLEMVDCGAINEILWKSLFFMVDASRDNQKMIDDLTSIILAIFSVARKKTNLITFTVLPIIQLIISNDFMCISNETTSETFLHLFFNLVLKKDKTLLLKFDPVVFKSIFLFKRSHLSYLRFFKSVLHKNKLSTGLAASVLEPCHAFWCFLADELKLKLDDSHSDTLELKLCFFELLTWPLPTLNAFCNEKLISIWKEMFVLYNSRVSQSNLNKLVIEHVTLITEQSPELLCIPEFVHFIILSLKLQEFTIDTCEVVYEIISFLNQIISIPKLPLEAAVIYQFTVMHLLESTPKLSYLPRIIWPLIDILRNIITKYNKINVIYALKSFVNTIPYTPELIPHIKKITEIMAPLESDQLYAEHAIFVSKTIESKMVENVSKIKPNATESLVLFGQTVTAPEKDKEDGKVVLKEPKLSKKAAKLDKDSNIVYINSPYKFDPKRLTKTQKEKLSRRRDDIPALYADLSQSQSRNFDSNSESSHPPPNLTPPTPETPMVIEQPLQTADMNIPIAVELTPVDSIKIDAPVKIPKTPDLCSPACLEDTKLKDDQSRKPVSKPALETTNPVIARKKRRKSTIMTINQKDETKQPRRKSPDVHNTQDTRTTRELKRMKMDFNDEHVYKTIYKRRTRSGIVFERVPTPPPAPPPPSPPPPASKNRHSTRLSDTSTAKVRKYTENSSSDDDSEPIIENTPEATEINLKQFKIPALYHLEAVKPGEHLAIGNGNRSVDLIKGPKITSPFKVIENIPKVNNNDIQGTGARTIDLQTISGDSSRKIGEKIVQLIAEQVDNDETFMKGDTTTDPSQKELKTDSTEEGSPNTDTPPEPINLPEPENPPEEIKTFETSEMSVSPSKIDVPEAVDLPEMVETPKMVNLPEKVDSLPDEEALPVVDTLTQMVEAPSGVNHPPPKTDDTPTKTDPPPLETPETASNQDDPNTQLIEAPIDIKLYDCKVEVEDIPATQPDIDSGKTPIKPVESKQIDDKTQTFDLPSNNTRPQSPPSEPPKMVTEPITISDSTAKEVDTTLDISITKPGIADPVGGADEIGNLNTADTETAPTELSSESSADVFVQNDVCRKVFLNTTDDVTPKEEFESPVVANNIRTSPVQTDTPTRNRELMRSTLEISPIKNQGEGHNIPDISPVLFNSESSGHSVESGKSLRRDLGSRSAHMMDLISAKTGVNFTSSVVKKKKSMHKVKKCTYSSPSQNRIAKMMEQCERPPEKLETTPETKDEISEADIFSFTRNLPSPTASPSIGILSKRKELESPDDSLAPAAKRKRVNFADPPVSSRKFIEKNAKQKFSPALKQMDIIPQEPRILRSSTSKDTENPYQIKEHLTEIADQIIKKYVTASENKLTPAKDYNTTDPICPALTNCTDPIMVIIPNLTSSDFINPTLSILKLNNIKTIGHLAQRTELQVHQIPLRVETVKAVLSGYKIAVTPVKPPRKIKPTSFTFNDPKSCEVSVITSSSRDEGAESAFLGEASVGGSSEGEDAESVVRWSPKPEFGEDLSYLSPNSFKDSILAEEMFGSNIQNILLAIISVLNDKNYDPKPLLQILFGGISNLTNILVNMGTFKVHHLSTVQNWNEIVSDIITQIGIWKLMRLLCRMNNVPQALMISALLKHSVRENSAEFVCEQLDKNEILKFVVKHFDLPQIIHKYGSASLKTSLTDLATNSKYADLNCKDVLIELYSTIIENPAQIGVALSKLTVLEIGEAVVQRLDSKTELTEFMEQIYACVPPPTYLTPIPRELLAQGDAPLSMEMVENGTISKDSAQHLFRCVARIFSISELTDLFYSEIKKKM